MEGKEGKGGFRAFATRENDETSFLSKPPKTRGESGGWSNKQVLKVKKKKKEPGAAKGKKRNAGQLKFS